MSGSGKAAKAKAASAPTPAAPTTDDRFDNMSPTLIKLLKEVFNIRDAGLQPHLIRALKYEQIEYATDFIDLVRNWEVSPLGYPDPALPGAMMFLPHHVITKMELLLAWARQRQHDKQRDLVETDWDDMDAAEFLALRSRVVTSTQPFLIPLNMASIGQQVSTCFLRPTPPNPHVERGDQSDSAKSNIVLAQSNVLLTPSNVVSPTNSPDPAPSSYVIASPSDDTDDSPTVTPSLDRDDDVSTRPVDSQTILDDHSTPTSDATPVEIVFSAVSHSNLSPPDNASFSLPDDNHVFSWSWDVFPGSKRSADLSDHTSLEPTTLPASPPGTSFETVQGPDVSTPPPDDTEWGVVPATITPDKPKPAVVTNVKEAASTEPFSVNKPIVTLERTAATITPVAMTDATRGTHQVTQRSPSVTHATASSHGTLGSKHSDGSTQRTHSTASPRSSRQKKPWKRNVRRAQSYPGASPRRARRDNKQKAGSVTHHMPSRNPWNNQPRSANLLRPDEWPDLYGHRPPFPRCHRDAPPVLETKRTFADALVASTRSTQGSRDKPSSAISIAVSKVATTPTPVPRSPPTPPKSPRERATRGLRYSATVRPPPTNDKQTYKVDLMSISSSGASSPPLATSPSVAWKQSSSPPPATSASAFLRPKHAIKRTISPSYSAQSSLGKAKMQATISQVNGLPHTSITSSSVSRDHHHGPKGSPTFENRIRPNFEELNIPSFELSATQVSNPSISPISFDDSTQQVVPPEFGSSQPNRVAVKPQPKIKSVVDLLDTSSPSNNSDSPIQQDLPVSVGIPSAITTDHAVSPFTDIHSKGNTDNDGSLKDADDRSLSRSLTPGHPKNIEPPKSLVDDHIGLAERRKNKDAAQDRFRRAMERVKTSLTTHWSCRDLSCQVSQGQDRLFDHERRLRNPGESPSPTPVIDISSPIVPETSVRRFRKYYPSVPQVIERAISDQEWGVDLSVSYPPSPRTEVVSSKSRHVSTHVKSNEPQPWPHVYPHKIKDKTYFVTDHFF